jgi:hypothetical protein
MEQPTKRIEFITRDEYLQMERVLAQSAEELPKVERVLKREFNRREVVEAFRDAFELIGGVTRLAVWANNNPTEFYRLYAKLLPKETEHTGNAELVIKHVLPPSKLDD